LTVNVFHNVRVRVAGITAQAGYSENRRNRKQPLH
jgi:hypothetical protein